MSGEIEKLTIPAERINPVTEWGVPSVVTGSTEWLVVNQRTTAGAMIVESTPKSQRHHHPMHQELNALGAPLQFPEHQQWPFLERPVGGGKAVEEIIEVVEEVERASPSNTCFWSLFSTELSQYH